MQGSQSSKRRWRVGELAETAGVTVRTLHHYEQAGLLASTERTSGDHRLYDAAGVETLYRIRVLRELGLSLEDIRKVINGGATLSDMLRTHLNRVEQDVERQSRLRDRLRSLTRSRERASTDDLLATLDAMSQVERHVAARRARREQSGERPPPWRKAGAALRAAMEAGAKPSSKRAMAAAVQARTLIQAFAEGDAKILMAMARLREVKPPADFAGWDGALMRYLDQALAAYDGE